MAKSIDVDFELLQTDINKLNNLKKELKKPEISCKYDMITDSNIGKGDVKDAIFETTTYAKEYYDVALALIENTVKYLNSIKALKDKDAELAKKIGEK